MHYDYQSLEQGITIGQISFKKLYLCSAFIHPKLEAETKRYNPATSCNLDLITILHLDLFAYAVPWCFLGMEIVGLCLKIFILLTIKIT